MRGLSQICGNRLALAGAGLAICALLGVGSQPLALAAKGDLHLGSRQSAADGGAGANSWSYGGSLSASGRFLAFRSEANNLGVHDAGNLGTTVYVYDFKRQRVETVSRASNLGLGANDDSRLESISANGRFVVFRTQATNLGGPIVANENIYVYDRKRDRVELISRRSRKRGGGGANQNADDPSISANGRYVAFSTRATNLGGPITEPGRTAVYVRDRKLKKTTLVSRKSGRHGKAPKADSFDPQIAPKAPVVTFLSTARHLAGPVANDAYSNVYAYDWKRRKVKLVSRRSGSGKGANENSHLGDISANGKQIAFLTTATNLGGPKRGPAGTYRAYVRNLASKRTVLVGRQSKADGGKGANESIGTVVLSFDGRYLAFTTGATNFGKPVNDPYNVYVYDRKRKKLILASRAGGGGPGVDDYAAEPSLAGSAPFVSFSTAAMNIDPPGEPAYHGNYPAATNIYRFQFGR